MKAMAAATMLAMALAACAPGGVQAGAPTPSQSYEFVEADSGRTITAPVGQTVAIRLEGIPTAGYIWRLESQPPAFLAPGEPAVLPTTAQQSEPGFTGGNHWMVFPYTVTGPGKAELVFHFGRPWELAKGAEPEKIFRLTIKGQAPSR